MNKVLGRNRFQAKPDQPPKHNVDTDTWEYDGATESARLAKVWHEWLEVDMDAHGWKHGDLDPLNAAADEAEVNEGRAEYITHMLRTLIAADPTLTAWEEDFLSSVTKQFDTKGRLSDKQVARLELIYAEKAE
jgi:hypothetical protein